MASDGNNNTDIKYSGQLPDQVIAKLEKALGQYSKMGECKFYLYQLVFMKFQWYEIHLVTWESNLAGPA